LYERAVTTFAYSRLLSKWEKREDSGKDMQRDADMIYEGVLGENYGGRSRSDREDREKGKASSLCLGAMISYPLKL